MNKNTLVKLEYYKILEILRKKCSSELAKKIAEDLLPGTDAEQIAIKQKETSEAVLVRRFEGSVPLAGIVDTFDSVRLAEKGGILNQEEIGKIRENLYAAKNVFNFFNRKINYDIPLLITKAGEIQPIKDLETSINIILDEENQIKDSASDTLWGIRRKKRTLNERIKSKLDSILRNSNTVKYLQEAIVTSRQGRYVVPVKIEYRQHIPGIVHDQSASGATLFIEPSAVVEMNNELKKCEIQEEEEITRILQEISAKIAGSGMILKRNLSILAEIDFIMAKGILSTELECVEPVIIEGQRIRIKDARHPLIDISNVVPISFELGYDFDALVITGPNTGGKTVTIKTAGLFVLMTQSGLHLPAEKAELGIFNKVFCDIGDEQSIEQSLSTFSSHMKNIIYIIDNTDEKTLVLLDELGAGTDPSEGANLAIAIIKHFLMKKSRIIATTHYSDLKVFAYNHDRVENASVEFDNISLRPTYKLLIGIPGKSNALDIARRLGLIEDIIVEARSMISEEEKDVSGLIEKLEKDAFYGERNLEDTKTKLAEATSLLDEVKKRERSLLEREGKIIRKAEEEAYGIIRKAKIDTSERLKEIKELLDKDKEEALRMANDLKKELEKEEGSLYNKISSSGMISDPEAKETYFFPGMEVFVPKFSQKGVVIDILDQELYLQVGIMKIKVGKNEVTVPKEKEKTLSRSGITKIKDEKTMAIKTEIDLRGLTVEEAISAVDKYIDDAKIAGLHSVSLIHGKGTGALRIAINDFLKTHHFVKKSRYGDSREGGHGVTIVEIK